MEKPWENNVRQNCSCKQICLDDFYNVIDQIELIITMWAHKQLNMIIYETGISLLSVFQFLAHILC
jgi:hypothetical protein